MTTNTNTNTQEINTHYYNYLDTILPVLTEIYKCPCKTCIDLYTEKILEIVPNIKEFYYFLIDCQKIIKQNVIYLKKIKELIPNMITFNNDIIHDIVCINTQISVSVIYNNSDNVNDTTELQNRNTRNSIYTLNKLFQYYPDMREEIV